MDPFVEEIQSYIGGPLRDIGATLIKSTRTGDGLEETNVCFLSVADKIIAISHAPRDGFTCFIGDAASVDLSRYETWDTLWHRLGMDKNIETDEGLLEYIRMFPSDAREYVKFMGDCLVKYFGKAG